MLPPRRCGRLITSKTAPAPCGASYGRCHGNSKRALGVHAGRVQGRSHHDRLRPPVDSVTQLRHHYNDYMLQ